MAMNAGFLFITEEFHLMEMELSFVVKAFLLTFKGISLD